MTILYDLPNQQWLAHRFYFSRNPRPAGNTAFKGLAVAVRPVLDHPEQGTLLRQIEESYRLPPPSDKTNKKASYQPTTLYGPELLGQYGDTDLMATLPNQLEASLPASLKILHILGDLNLYDPTEGIVLSIGRTATEGNAERLTADTLAYRLRQLGISRTLIILESLSAGSVFEDTRLLMLRNRYANALAQLGVWTVLAIGPRREDATQDLLKELIAVNPLEMEQLEQKLFDIRRNSAAPGSRPGMYGYYGLFFPTASA